MKVQDLENSPLLTSRFQSGEDAENPEGDPDQESPDEIGENGKCFHPLLAIIVVLVVFLIGVLGIVVFVNSGGTDKEAKICKTNECLTLSTALLNWNNAEVDPCEDFYEHTCGKYSVHTGTDGTRVVEKEQIVRKLITDLVHKNLSTIHTSKSERTMNWLYWKCMELKSSEVSSSKVRQIYNEVYGNIRKIGHWPTAEGSGWKKESFDLNDMLANMARLHMTEFGLFEVHLLEHLSSDTRKQLVIAPSSSLTAVPKDELVELAQNLLDNNDLSHQKPQLSTDIQKFFELDRRFRRHVPLKWDVHEASYSEIKEKLPSIDFDKVCEQLLGAGGNWTALRSKIRSRKFQAFYEEDNIESVIKATDPRDLANYLIFKYIEFGYSFITMSKQVIEQRKCDELVINLLPRASLRIFVRHHFQQKNLKVAEELVNDIKANYIEMISESTWIDEMTKKNALDKLRHMKTMIGYTKDYQEEGKLDQIFESLPIQANDSFYGICTKIQRFRTEQLMEYILTDNAQVNPVDILVEANAFYFPLKNGFNILIPFLDKPLFEASYPKFVNLAGVGRVLAHEIGHAFDTHGRFTNYDGSFGKWWSTKSTAEYNEKAQCFVDQYEKFIVPQHEKSLNASQLLNEMLADNLGTEVAWRAYKKLDLSKENGLYKLDDISIDELYFRVAALDFCAPLEKKPVKKTSETKHPAGWYRVNGVFRNLPAFAETFKCPVGSPMNPSKRCTLF